MKSRSQHLKMVHWMLAMIAMAAPAASAAEGSLYHVGVASIDITPTTPIRLSGYGVRREESTGVIQKLWAKAIAIGSDRQGPAILLTVDSIGVPEPMTEEVARRLHEKTGLARERFALCSTHTHTAPQLAGMLRTLFGVPIPPEHQARIDRYTRELTDKLEEVCLKALADRRPGRLAWGEGKAGFAGNRRTKGGPVDHALPVLTVRDPGGALRAVVAGYACHCTTIDPGDNKVCGDWAGYAQEYIQDGHPGAVAMITIGCGADSNPYPRPGLDKAQRHGREITDEVARLLDGELKPLGGKLDCRLQRINLPFDTLPTREQWEERARGSDAVGYHARVQLERLDRGEPLQTELPYTVQIWRFGEDLAMVFLAGEVVVDYSLRLKKEFDAGRMWVNAYANDVPCYIPSRRIWDEGGYEGGGAMTYYDRPTRLAGNVEELIFASINELMPASFRSEQLKSQYPDPQSPETSLASIQTRKGLKVELVAAEPLVIDPIAIDWGADGRLWVVEMRDYPTGIDERGTSGGRIKVLEDSDADGQYDQATIFLDGLTLPTGLMTWRDGVLICAAPDIIFARDIDGDGVADERKTLFTGFATHNFQARVNGLSYGLDHWVYGAGGIFGGAIESIATGRKIDITNRDFRMNPDAGVIEPASGRSQQGRVHDDWGNWFGNDNGTLLWHFPLAERYARRNPHVAPPQPSVYLPSYPESNRLYPASVTLERFNDFDHVNRVTSACGPEIYRDDLLGPEFTANAFVCLPVHNLVHRLVLTPRGVTFEGRRAEDERQSEFLASTDNWFRPVQVRTGVDGSLWVVDMYRFVIEDPVWIPKDKLARLDVRAGSDRGRIYRVYREDTPPRSIPDLTAMDAAQLAAMLDAPNGALRDLVHRQLIQIGGSAAKPRLELVARESDRPAARVEALSALDGLGLLSPALLETALADAHPQVRRRAVRLSEGNFDKSTSLAEAVLALVDDPDEIVRYQLALSLGEWDDPGAGRALGRIALSDLDDPWMRAAVLSSSMRHADQVLASVLASGVDSPARDAMVGQLISVAGASGDPAILLQTGLAIAPEAGAEVKPGQWIVVARYLESLDRAGLTLASLEARDVEAARSLTRRLHAAFAEARALAVDPSADVDDRRAAIGLLGREKDHRDGDLDLLAGLLDPRAPLWRQTAGVEALGRLASPRIPELLLAGWMTQTPAIRTRVLDMLLSRQQWTERLLTAIEEGRIAPRQIGAARRERLFHLENSDLKARARAALAAARPADRAEALRQFQTVKTLTGDPARGASLFGERCASCHRFRGQGFAVGPDLAALNEKSTEGLLTAILDPNAALEDKFANYMIRTADGRSLSGMIRSETATALTLIQSGGVNETLLRKDIEELRGSSLSLMPEGLEEELEPLELADLIAYVQSAPAPLGSGAPEQLARAREQFYAGEANGVAEIVASMESLRQVSWLGPMPLELCRQTDGSGKVRWRTQPTPMDWDGVRPYRFRMAAAMGWMSEPPGYFELKMNGGPVLRFNATTEDAAWRSEDGRVTMRYTVMQNNEQDGTGVLEIEAAPALLKAGKSVEFEVAGSASDSRRWFGLLTGSAQGQK